MVGIGLRGWVRVNDHGCDFALLLKLHCFKCLSSLYRCNRHDRKITAFRYGGGSAFVCSGADRGYQLISYKTVMQAKFVHKCIFLTVCIFCLITVVIIIL